jgi:hypothetical protein
MFAEVNPAHRFIADDFLWIAGGQHRSLVDDVGAVADTQCFTHVVVRDQHADAALFQEAYDALYLDDSDRIDTCERLIQQDEARISRQCASDLDAASLATR